MQKVYITFILRDTRHDRIFFSLEDIKALYIIVIKVKDLSIETTRFYKAL